MLMSYLSAQHIYLRVLKKIPWTLKSLWEQEELRNWGLAFYVFWKKQRYGCLKASVSDAWQYISSFLSVLDSSDILTSQKNKPTEETLCNSAAFITPSPLVARTFLLVCPIANLQNQWDSIIFRRKMSASHPDSVAHHWNKSWGLRRV